MSTDFVTIIDVTARDGLQDASAFVPIEAKRELLQGIRDAGILTAEAASFVHPRWVPMLPDAEEVMAFAKTLPEVEWIALVPNLRGMERAVAGGGMGAVTVVCSASEEHNRANLNRSRQETLDDLSRVVALAHRHGIRVRGAVSTSFDCPFVGKVPLADVLWVTESYLAMGVDEISVADTIGTANPRMVTERISAINAVRGTVPVSLHLHDRFSWGLANVAVALEQEVRRLECALGGLGGCPFAPGAAGNLDAERLIPFLTAQGIETGVDLDRLGQVRRDLLEVIAKGQAAPALHR